MIIINDMKVIFTKMKLHFIIFICFASISAFLYGQDNVLISSKQVSNSKEKASKILRKSDSYTSVEFVDINLDKILEFDKFELRIGERNIPIEKERIEARGINNYVFVGSNSNGCRVLLSILGKDIQGVIETEEDVFTIETVGKKQYALLTVDYSKLREACDDIYEGDDHSSFEEANSHDNVSEPESNGDETDFPILNAVSEYECKIRVLVLYTPNAQSSVSDIKNTILTAVALTNQSFINSQINYQIELVYAGQTNYTESSYSLDLSRFSQADDGYMEEVHTLRNKYSADVCVLLTYDPALCGIANGIGVSETGAFCIVSTYATCATSNYSFGHEIGHLLGCRHDPYMDPNTTPFAYGHGFVHPMKIWRTIMAYSNACDGCQRLQYWSNPSVIKNGVPMGTVATNNNARVWNERSGTIMAFRQPYNNVIFTNGALTNSQYADVIAKNRIATIGPVTVNSGNTLQMRAGHIIKLQPGFSVQTGAEFFAKIEDIEDCEECNAKVIVQNVPEEYDERSDVPIETESDFSYSVYLSSSKDLITVNYSLDKEIPLSIELLNLFGKRIKTILPKRKQQSGAYILQIPVSDFTAGTYFLTLSSPKQKKTEKIIIK